MTTLGQALRALAQSIATPTAIPLPSPTAPAREAAAGPLAVALREVMAIPPAYLAQLPLPTTLVLACGTLTLVATSSRSTHAELWAAGVPAITARGLCHLALAAENGRASHEALLCWLEQGEPRLGVTLLENVAYGGAYALETPTERWPLGRVVAAWGLTPAGLSVGEGPDSEVLV